MTLAAFLLPLSRQLLPAALLLSLFAPSAKAQIVPDATLRNNSDANLVEQQWNITGGETVGSTLFHSFGQFSVPTNQTAFFNNIPTLDRIIARVTGGQISSIDGLLRANGTADIFFINPSGITFGPNAQLNIGGSFIGSTAEGIQLANGSIFSAKTPNSPPLLGVNIPVGLQLGQNPGTIRVEGTGHLLTQADFFTPIDRAIASAGLRVASGNTLALVGGDLTLSGGILAADGGRVELGSVENTLVGLATTRGGWALGYNGIPASGNIRLLTQALVDASGTTGGNVRVQGRTVELRDGSVLLIQSQGGEGGSIQVSATESVEISGIDRSNSVRSGFYTENIGTGGGGDVMVNVPKFLLSQGGVILVTSYGTARGSNITVNASELVELNSAPPQSPIFVSAIAISNISPESAGNITISTDKLRLIDGAGIVATAFSSGFGGNVAINATESVEVTGIQPSVGQRSVMAASSFSTGDAGTLQIDTKRLVLRGAGNVATTTGADGRAGRLIINATELVDVSGFDPVTETPSRIDSSGIIFSPAIQRIFRLPPVPSGDAGGVEINTNVLRVTDGGSVSVENQGSGNAGVLSVRANRIAIARGGQITASTTSGEGGNIALNVRDSLLLRNSGQIAARAAGAGNGGNITIDSPFVVAVRSENSDIVANAVAGNGGNIDIATNNLFGFDITRGPLDDTLSEINASSRTGIAGIVNIERPEVTASAGLVELPQQVIDPSDQVVVGCAAAVGNSFAITGRGGLPRDPAETLRGQTLVEDLRDWSSPGETVASMQSSPQAPPLREAKGWVINAAGNVELVASSDRAPRFLLSSSRCTRRG
ncbi:MAG: filamentous hemagglutinin N-terminal domain-containing protein [Cyanobacteriota bacterium]|nr:filamentous hemagglutinin N-terminal domain-containing protein [Cyanobacteriota bacterium]